MQQQNDSVAVTYKNAFESKLVTSVTLACDMVFSSDQQEMKKPVQ